MSALEQLTSIVGGTAAGGLTGGLMSLGNHAIDFIMERQRAKDAREEKKLDHAHELAILSATQDRDREVAQEQLVSKKFDQFAEEVRASYEGMMASIADQTSLTNNNNPLQYVRPGLTLMLIVGAFIFGITNNENPLYQFSSMSSFAVAWWFGDRQRMAMRGKNG